MYRVPIYGLPHLIMSAQSNNMQQGRGHFHLNT